MDRWSYQRNIYNCEGRRFSGEQAAWSQSHSAGYGPDAWTSQDSTHEWGPTVGMRSRVRAGNQASAYMAM